MCCTGQESVRTSHGRAFPRIGGLGSRDTTLQNPAQPPVTLRSAIPSLCAV